MKLGVMLPNEVEDADPREIARLAQRAEELGYTSVWLPDHLLPPGPFGDVFGGVHEALMLLANIAARTERITLGTSVLILPLREPVLLAKQLATLERLAPGRVILGAGVGWQEDEFAALDVPFNRRGKRTDEILALVAEAHATGRLRGGVLAPRPTARIPLLIGGKSEAALRRAARVGDLWQAYNVTPEAWVGMRDRLDELAGERKVSAGTVIRAQRGMDLKAEAERWRAVGAEHLAIHPGRLEGAAELLA
ncbi:LLM class flavin-dependent oxidoreductase [Solirubrobacter phytolaccae]|uniref:LLM class flavin-dependent oxidoreductase n=1 Tax=Solirubrobacter phytolaccae TaxID=1404360 RepID=A0A9X3SEG6_9ACTN|nr:LLM class flavin-dependent oxidoreductase [Solirubrobacter phytolaccae]MDA0184835.1 LLM class flavin-dependent oxidoreductase [Solirubrobacter phytolaccae]